jgi:hypothetical protein
MSIPYNFPSHYDSLSFDESVTLHRCSTIEEKSLNWIVSSVNVFSKFEKFLRNIVFLKCATWKKQMLTKNLRFFSFGEQKREKEGSTRFRSLHLEGISLNIQSNLFISSLRPRAFATSVLDKSLRPGVYIFTYSRKA